MSYIFPRRFLRTGDVLDPVELTEDISPAADRVSGKLNMHNFNQTVASTIGVQDNAFYETSHYAKYAEIVWTRSTGPEWGYPEGPTTSDMVLVQNNFEWQAILDGAPEATQVILTTGTSVLWINAYVQYVWWGFSAEPGSITTSSNLSPLDQHINGAQYVPANVQFALRVNGNIVPETITGIDDLTYRASVPIKPLQQRAASGSILPGPQDIRGNQVCALGPPCLPVRLGACVPVQPGEQIVELVVRRAPYVTDTEIKQYGAYDKVYLYSRQINVVDLKMFPVDSVSPSEISAPAFQPEDALTTTSLYTDRLQPVVAGYNAVAEGALQRGALMHYHLPGALAGAPSIFEIGTSSWTFNCFYPGGTSLNTVTATYYSGAQATGWCRLWNSMSVTVPVTTPRKLLILANVQVRNVSGRVRRSADETIVAAGIDSFALFQLMYQSTTAAPLAWTSIPASIGMVNNFVWWPSNPASSDIADRTVASPDRAEGVEHVEIQLMAMMDIGAALANPLNIGVFGSVANTSDECEIIRGSLYVIPLRA